MSYSFSIQGGDIVMKEIESGKVVWQGRPDDALAEKVLAATDGLECVVLLDYGGVDMKRAHSNVLRLHLDGSITWRAELPDPSTADSYTEIELTRHGLRAYSWSGYSVLLDEDTGKIISREFVK